MADNLVIHNEDTELKFIGDIEIDEPISISPNSMKGFTKGNIEIGRAVKITPFGMKTFRPKKDLPLPFTKDRYGNAGYDLHATEELIVRAGEIVKVPVNARFSIPQGWYGNVTPRSGLSSKGINVIPGTIDSNFRGQIKAIVQNMSGEDFKVEYGMRIAQIIFIPHAIVDFVEVDTVEDLGETLRGESGFGDSGLK